MPPSDIPQLEKALYGLGEHACRTCRLPMVRDPATPPDMHRVSGSAILDIAFVHQDPDSTCPTRRAAPVLGWTTRGLAVFKTTAYTDDDNRNPYPRTYTPRRRDHHDNPLFRYVEPDTTGADWWW